MSAVMKGMTDAPSPNHNARSHPIRCIVLHADGSPKESATLSWVATPDSKVSYHVLIARDGTAYRIVPDDRRAYAVGYAAWKGVRDVNSVSLSLAFSNRDDGKELLTTAQMIAAQAVIAEWKHKWAIEDVTTHKIVSRWKNGKELDANGHRRKVDPEMAPNFILEAFL